MQEQIVFFEKVKMLARRLLGKIKSLRSCNINYQCITSRPFCSDKNIKSSSVRDDGKNNLTLGAVGSKYQVFRDEDSEIIMDVNEERLKYATSLQTEELEEKDPFEGLNLERGITGVFDIEDMVSVLKRENSEDLFVATVPPEYKYVDYICVVSGKSHRHMLAIAQFVRKVFKQKMHKGDLIPKLEGGNSNEWMAMDLGNIALHIFSKEARITYDIDSLWTVGPEFDRECNKQDPIVKMLERHSVYLRDLQPAE